MARKTSSLVTFGMVISLAALAFSQVPQDIAPEVLAYADMVFYNGKVLTADEKFTVAPAVAVRDGKILAIGEDSRILRMAGPKTLKINMRGNSVLPGFYSVHADGNFEGNHGPGGPYGTVPTRFPDLDTGLRNIKKIVDAAKPGAWVMVDIPITKLTYDPKNLNRDVLDTVAPNNPLLVNYALDSVVNSLALNEVLKDFPPEMPGVMKDEKGEPNGQLRGFAHGRVTYEINPWPESDEMEKLVQRQKQVFQMAVADGITLMGGQINGIATTVTHALWERGELPIRLRLSHDFARMNARSDAFYRRLGNLMYVGDGWYKIGGGTTMSLDGTPDRAGVLTLKPKLAEPPGAGAYGPYGESKWEGSAPGMDWRKYSDFNTVILANHYGWNITDLHTRGDRGVEIFLEAMDEANKDHPLKGRRYSFMHGDMRTPEQIKRLTAYDAIMSIRSKYLFMETGVVDLYKVTYGADAIHRMFPVKSMIDAGLKPVLESNYEYAPTSDTDATASNDQAAAAGDVRAADLARSDVQVAFNGQGSPPMPKGFTNLGAMEKFITRKNEITGQVWGLDEKITRQQVLWMATSWASRAYGDEKTLGTIEPGKLADLVILGGDYMGVPEERISDIPVLMTIIDGKVMFEKEGNPLRK